METTKKIGLGLLSLNVVALIALICTYPTLCIISILAIIIKELNS